MHAIHRQQRDRAVKQRMRYLLAVLAVVGLVTVAPPAGAVDGSTAPIPSSLATEPFSAGRFRVTVYAERLATTERFICIEAVARTEQGSDLTVEYEGTCFDDSPRNASTYRFAPVRWVASITGRLMTNGSITTYRRGSSGEWVVVSDRERQSTATVDLHWTGRGASKTEPIISGGLPLSCLVMPPVCTSVTTAVTRGAGVKGSVTFNGIGVVATVPRGLAGTMTIGH